MSMELSAQREVLPHVTRTDPDPRVRRRAHALLLLSRGQSVMAVARLFETAPHRVRAWRSRFLIGGRQGLAGYLPGMTIVLPFYVTSALAPCLPFGKNIRKKNSMKNLFMKNFLTRCCSVLRKRIMHEFENW